MVSIEELTRLDTSKFTKAADGWSTISHRAHAYRERVDHDMLSKLRATQQGAAATAVLSDLDRLSKNYQYVHAEGGLIRTALQGLAEELAVPQRKLKQALEDARGLGFTVKPNGSVEYPKTQGAPSPLLPTPAAPGAMPSLLKPDSTPDANQAKAQDIANRIGEALKEATEIDGRYARAIAKLSTDGDLKKTDWTDVARDTKDLRAAAGKHLPESGIPKGKSPKENAEWWKSRSQAEREEYTALYPASIGALNGIPSATRDEANQVVLAETRADVNQQLKDLVAREPQRYVMRTGQQTVSQEWMVWKEKKESIEGKLDGLEAIQDRLAQAGGDERIPKAYLLGLDARGDGHAIVANGNPDTAAHTAVYIPGTYSNLAGAEGDIGRMVRLWKVSDGMPGNPDVSTITWIGYDAPQSIVPQAMSKSYAYNGESALNGFMDGLQVAQGGADKSHTTIIGHSYGSTLVGAAANKGELAADDVVVAGSPGTLVSDADKLDVGKDHVWSERASDDPVPLGGKIAGLGGVQRVVVNGGDRENGGYVEYIHVVPSDEEFGAHRMKVDTKGHSGYWDERSISLRNQAAVVTRRYDMVESE
ncbi:alpha/beta hydrolase [Streptomyces sp. NPDC021096]|uniref:alpha/beta hydrolase n=1 Tax=Streptomyces sp. NPDC021096 TaxID=3154792 RepID=UPI0033FEE5FA